MHKKKRVLVTGASGYVGSRLLHLLTKRNDLELFAFSRRELPHLKNELANIELRLGNALEYSSVKQVLEGIDCVFYLIHSMAGDNYEQKDRQAAENFANAATHCGVSRIIYLGGLVHEDGIKLSRHFRSRLEVGRIFRENKVQLIELQASIVLGAGSTSFEMIRALVERLPVMICPRWVKTPCPPSALNNANGVESISAIVS